jgi:hypothetical protein
VKTSQNNPEEESAKLSTQASGSKSLGRNIRLKRKELAQLLLDHLEELLLSCSKVKPDNPPPEEPEDTPLPSLSLQEIRAELEDNDSQSFSLEEIEHFCFQLKDQVRGPPHPSSLTPLGHHRFLHPVTAALHLLRFTVSVRHPRSTSCAFLPSIFLPGTLDLIEHITMIAEEHRSRKFVVNCSLTSYFPQSKEQPRDPKRET